jgi:hypothetical protein
VVTSVRDLIVQQWLQATVDIFNNVNVRDHVVEPEVLRLELKLQVLDENGQVLGDVRVLFRVACRDELGEQRLLFLALGEFIGQRRLAGLLYLDVEQLLREAVGAGNPGRRRWSFLRDKSAGGDEGGGEDAKDVENFKVAEFHKAPAEDGFDER